MVQTGGGAAMAYLFKAISILLVLILQVQGDTVAPLGVMGLLLLSAIWIIREKYLQRPAIMAAEYVLVIALSFLQPVFLLLTPVLAFDLAARGLYWQIALLLPAGVYFISGVELSFFVLVLALCALCGHLRHTLDKKEQSFREVYDMERRNRYSLEEAKVRLMNSAREAAHLAEIRERNRIARDIHDSLGHSLAGILLQLQVAVKTLDRDEEKARELLQASVTGLAESVNLLRDTVHNIRPREKLGLEYFQNVIGNFNFCQVDFQHSGDISCISPDHTEIISALLKEALTNASRYSQATKMEVSLEVRSSIVRLFIRDNGVGCKAIKEGMGISGMKERVRNAGGTISINPENGFTIVCVLPREDSAGGEVIASINRR